MIAQQAESIAVLDLEGRGISATEAASLTDRLRSQLVRTGKVTVVERGQMQQILGEQDFQLTGCTSNECAVEIGQMLGVTSMVAGSIGKIGSTYTIDLRTIDMGTGEITGSIMRDYRGEIDGLIAEMGLIAKELVAMKGFKEAAPLEAKPSMATITIGSRPPGALILIDGQGVGATPQSGLEVEPDQPHTVTISLEGYQSADTTLFAEAGGQYTLEFPLEALKSWLTILSTPSGASVAVDGQGVGTTPQSGLGVEPNQLHSVSLNLAGYQPVDTTILTEAGQQYALNFPMSALKSWLTIQSLPTGARIVLDGREIGSTPLSRFEVRAGIQHAVSLKLAGHQQVDTTYFAQAGGFQRLNIRLRPVKRELAAVTTPTTPPKATQQPKPPPTVGPKKTGGGFLLLVLTAAAGGVGYYGYTEGWFDGEPPGNGNGNGGEEPLTVGSPPPVPTP